MISASNRRAAAALAALAAGAAGCALDERTIVVQPETIVLGSFESDTLQADDARFGAWQTYSYGTTMAMLVPSILWLEDGPGCPNSNWCLSLQWQLDDAADGAGSVAGVGDRVRALAPIDLSAQSRIVFQQRYLSDQTCRAAASALGVIFRCDGLQSAVQAEVPLSSAGMTSSISLAAFREAAGGAARADCLAATTSIEFQIEVTVADGGCASGQLVLDAVTLR
jgi:hypothetical protein